MGTSSGKEEIQNQKHKRKRTPLQSATAKRVKKHKKKEEEVAAEAAAASSSASASEQLDFFVKEFQSAKGLQLSSLELESLRADTCILELPHASSDLGKNIRAAFGSSWKQVLCESQLVPGQIDPGSPAILVVASSAIRSVQLLRGFRSLTKQCPPAKLFSKHMKIEEQISLLKNRVNIASGTPSRIKKLIDTEALGLSRFKVLLLDMHPDVKGYSLFTLPQVRDEFWELFKNYFYQPMINGDLRICLHGPCQLTSRLKGKQRHHPRPDK